jgi:hypothetical protein
VRMKASNPLLYSILGRQFQVFVVVRKRHSGLKCARLLVSSDVAVASMSDLEHCPMPGGVLIARSLLHVFVLKHRLRSQMTMRKKGPLGPVLNDAGAFDSRRDVVLSNLSL